jgi:1-aminocyclopropane-1-carboxylate deaminase
MISLSKTIPLQVIENELTQLHKIKLYLLRLDTIDFYVGGNKLFKLKYNIEEVKKQKLTKVLTFGGVWSNHLAATAKACEENNLELICVVRGEEPVVYVDTLNYCKRMKAHLHFVSRADYRNRTDPDFIKELEQKFGNFYLLPEGGSNTLAIKGCKEILDFIPIDFNYICTPVGSGATLAGIATGIKQHQQALGFSVLKGAEYLGDEVHKLMINAGNTQHAVYNINHNYHFGGYAKTTPALLSFKKDFESTCQIPLDYVYTVKMMFGIFDLIQKKSFKEGSTLVALHTGGLQGNKGFEKS